MKKLNKTTLLTTFICLLPLVMTAIFWSQLPEELIVHFSTEGTGDRYASKLMVGIGLPCILAVINFICHIIMNIDRKITKIGNFLRFVCWWLCPLLSVVFIPLILLTALDRPFDITLVCSVLIGLVFVAIGAFLPNCTRNNMIGLRFPWAMNSDENWNRTHKLGGYTFVVCGILFILASWFSFAVQIALYVLLCVGFGAPGLYSMYLGKKGI